MSNQSLQRNIRTSYDTVAAEYATRLENELRHKPFDCELLDSFATQVRGLGTVADLGCGPAMVAQYLHERGVSVIGVDSSARMLEQAKRLHPKLTLRQADFTHLEVEDNAWGGITAFYALIHLPREALPAVLRDFFRVLVPGGMLLIGFHVGSETRHATDWWGQPVDLNFIFYEMSEMLTHVWGAGFDSLLHVEREPYPDIEVQTKRGYIVARKPNITVVV